MKNLISLLIIGSFISVFHTSSSVAQPREFGDAPEGALAYPATGVVGSFPTCKTLGPAGWVEHNNFGAVLGPAFEFDGEGNGGLCPQFNPYDFDECKGDGDAGLIIPGAFTIVGGVEVPCLPGDVAPLGTAGSLAVWGGNVDITVTNYMPSASPGYMNVIVDWAQDGSWGGTSEHILVDWFVPNGYAGLLSGLGPPNFVIGPNSGYVWARFTISEQPVGMNWDGSGSFEDGESEDYLLLVAPSSGNLDFGDAPDVPYPTLLASNGARHTNDGVTFIGAAIDNEVDGQPTANADGDDLAGLDDEDGVTFTSAMIPGQWATLNIVASANCLLNAWMDFNLTNGWADAGEQIFTNVLLITGLNTLLFQVPAGAASGMTCARFRVNLNGNLSYTGAATEGEVEDYRIMVGEEPPNYDFGDAPEGAYAYVPSGVFPNGVMGQFPTCTGVGPATWIQHTTSLAYFASFDTEPDGNAGLCPGFVPYDQDECKGGGDAGLIVPGAFINTLVTVNPLLYIVYPCVMNDNVPLGIPCSTAAWGTSIDITVQNFRPASAYVNVLIDWDQNGSWGGSSPCPLNQATEHVLVNFSVPSGYSGPLSGLQPPSFTIGPNPSWVWARFSITDQPVGTNWDGSGSFEDGETEDYLFIISNPALDFGDAPDVPYPTLLASNGARHTNDGVTFIGAAMDNEVDGQPTANADGDDLAGLDDEDGVTFTTPLIPGQLAIIQIVASVNCTLNAWMDINQLNGWADAGENIFFNQPLIAGLNALQLLVPPNAALGMTYFRFRVNISGGLSYTGAATEGEVEDYRVMIGEEPPNLDFGDAPEGVPAYPVSGVIGQFPTCTTILPSGIVQHTNFGAWFGPLVDFESDGNAGLCPGFAPYDADECQGDGDAGLLVPGAFTLAGLPPVVVPCPQSGATPLGNTCTTAQWGPNIDMQVQNLCPSGLPHFVNVLIDWDQNGQWGGGSPCPGGLIASEHVLVNFPVPNGYNGPLSGLQPPSFLIGPNAGHVWVRFTLSEVTVPPMVWDGSGSFEDGETEDYLLLVTEEEPDTYDFGDAPDGPYPTLLASNGASHMLGSGLMMGFLVDADADGQPTANADGDDLNNVDDEDGVVFTTQLIQGQMATLQITVTMACLLNAWMDFNQLNGWGDPGEQIFTNAPLGAGLNTLTFQVPAGAALGQTYLRFRVNQTGGLSFTGPATDGEVEDYTNTIVEPAPTFDFGDAPDGPYPTLLASNGASHMLGSGLMMGFLVDADADGQPTANADGDDLNNVDDEDGVVFTTQLIQGQMATLQITVTMACLLNAWMDFNQLNGWADANEQIFINTPLSAGLNTLTFQVPASATLGPTYLRFRVNTGGGLSYAGSATDGEVEDYQSVVTNVPGDANCDGIVNVLDVITIANYIMDLNPDPFCFGNADVNADGVINVLDIIGTVNIIMSN
ncbi:MAG TPA: dockerin type I repeat-containing protein [Bacteroidales bacterium]|nr:dockerin type I repeat-containing protein [Bacteroidales bacterium]